MSLLQSQYIQCDWPAAKNVRAYATTRLGGYSQGCYQGLNLAQHVGDSVEIVQQNRNTLIADLNLPSAPFWLNQVHGIDSHAYQSNGELVNADASFAQHSGQVCLVMTADCLPILFSNRQGTWIAACHAGWRGLLAGVIQQTIACYTGPSDELIAWIGPAISQLHFQVGAEVKKAFMQEKAEYSVYFDVSEEHTSKNDKFQFDMVGVAKDILQRQGISTFGGSLCSFADPFRFYSYRRDGETGRMAALIWLT